jgi:hypothetical protein
MYYGGMALVVLGILLFVGSGFMFGTVGRSAKEPEVPAVLRQIMEKQTGSPSGGQWSSQPGGSWQAMERQQREIQAGMRAMMVAALLGMGTMVVGAILMRIGARGAAGSGLVLDPQQARRDFEPWSRMGGGVVQDALSELGAVEPLLGKSGSVQPQVKVRCRQCQALNDESAKFCSQCGAAV